MKRILLIVVILLNLDAFATEYYVSTNGNDKNSGLTPSKSWRTISHAATKVKLRPGDIVWIKAGNYGNEVIEIEHNGLPGKPISFIGYKNKPGDIKSLYFSYAKKKKFNAGEMPLLDGKNRANGLKAISIHKTKYIVIKNIQIKNYRWGIYGGNASNSLVQGVLGSSFGDVRQGNDSGFGIQFVKGDNNVIKNSIFINATGSDLRIEGNKNLIDDVKAYCDDNSTGHVSSTDYYIHINGGNNNIIKNSYAERVGNLDHTGHGIGLKKDCQNNLIENCEVVNIEQAIELRHSGVKNNLVRNVLITGRMGSIAIRDGANNNIIENSIVKNTNRGIYFFDQTEDGQGGIVASNNIIRNTIFYNIKNLIFSTKANNVNKVGTVAKNKVINCTIINIENLFEGELRSDNSNEIVNSIIMGSKKIESKQSVYPNKWKFINSNFYKNGFGPIKGIGNISENPEFENQGKENYRLKSSSELIDAGKETNHVKKDFDGNKRPHGKSHDIGAFENNNKKTSSIKANAGKDATICSGESIKLTASGGSNYKWSTGATTKSITVKPTSTKKYTVTVSASGTSDSDDVIVKVNKVIADAGKNVTINEGENITLTARGGDSYSWDTGETTQSITVSPSKTRIYEVTVTKGACQDVDQVKATVKAKQNVVVADAGKDVIICSGENIKLTASGGSNYKWSTGATTKSITVKPTSTKKYTVTVSKDGTSDSDDVIVKVNKIIADAGKNVTINEGKNVTLTAKGGDSYLWDTGETTQSITVSPIKTRNYQVTVTKGDCQDVDQVKVAIEEVNQVVVVANAGKDVTICSGESIKLTASGGSNYKWNTGATTKSITVEPTSTQKYSVTVATGEVSDTDDVVVKVDEVIADAGKNVTIEEGNSVTLSAEGGDGYLWNTGETSQVITVSPIKTQDYEVTVTKGTCQDIDQVKVTVNSSTQTIVVADAGTDQEICKGETIKLTASGGSNFKWSTGATTKSIKVKPNSTKLYTVRVSEGGLSDSDEVYVIVNEVIADAGSNKTITEGESVKLTAKGGDSYQWNTGDTGKSIIVSPHETTKYEVTVTKGRCQDIDGVKITVNKLMVDDPKPIGLNAGNDITICIGESVTLYGSGGSNYKWSTGLEQKDIEVNPTRTTKYTLTSGEGDLEISDSVLVTVENCNLSNSNSNFNDDSINDSVSNLSPVFNDFKVYPNPSNGVFYINLKNVNQQLNVSLISMNGVVVYMDKIIKSQNNITKKLDFSSLARGFYFVKVFNGNTNFIKKILLI